MASSLIFWGINRRIQLQFPPRHQAYLVTRHENSSLCLMCLSDDIRLVVYIVFFLETVQTVLSGADLYYWFASGFGNVEQLTSPYASPFDVPIMGSLASLSVQFFFVYRIWVLSEQRSWWLCVIICLVTFERHPQKVSERSYRPPRSSPLSARLGRSLLGFL